MAKSSQKKYENSPFKDLGTYVFGDQFIGRQAYISRLQRECTTRNFSILGLPKVGKTSLVYESIINLGNQIKTKKPLCVVMFNVGTCTDPQNFFKKLVKNVYGELKRTIPHTQADDIRIIEELYGFVKEDNYDLDTIESFFESGIKSISAHLVLFFDEFDKVRKIGFSGNSFALLRAILQVPNVHGAITSNRSIFDLENWKRDSSSGPSNLYQLFDGNTIHLKPFDDHELEEYWEWLMPYFEAIGFPFDEDYQKKAIYYAGHHPHKLNIFNSRNYDSFKERKQLLTNEEIRSEMKSAYEAELDVLSSVDLLEASIQAIIGPVYDLTEEQADRLKQYGFLREVTESEKFEIIGTKIGVLEKQGDMLIAYAAPSDYFTKYMKSKYVNNPSYWDLWRETFCGLRDIVKRAFVDTYGENWYDDNSDPRMHNIINAIKSHINKDHNAGISVSHPIEYLDEGAIYDLLENNWHTFKDVFANCDDFFKKYKYIVKIRNHVGHINDRYLSDNDLDKANCFLQEIKLCIDDWLTHKSDIKLELIEVFKFVEGVSYTGKIISIKDKNTDKDFYWVEHESYPYPLRISEYRPYYKVGDTVSFTAKKSGKFWIAANLKKT